jgi:hypothetical protein
MASAWPAEIKPGFSSVKELPSAPERSDGLPLQAARNMAPGHKDSSRKQVAEWPAAGGFCAGEVLQAPQAAGPAESQVSLKTGK